MGYAAPGPAPYGYGHYAAPAAPSYYGQAPAVYGYYAQAPEYGYPPAAPELGWYAEAQEPFAGHGHPGELGYYAEYPELGYASEPVNGYGGYAGYGAYQEPPDLGYYGEPPGWEGYAEPVAYYAQEYPPQPVAGYGQMPEMVGYGDYGSLAENYPGAAGYADPAYAGYVRQQPPTYNPGCPMPTNVAGIGETEPLEGYVKPGTVNPTCDQFTPPPDGGASMPETFRPLW